MSKLRKGEDGAIVDETPKVDEGSAPDYTPTKVVDQIQDEADKSAPRGIVRDPSDRQGRPMHNRGILPAEPPKPKVLGTDSDLQGETKPRPKASEPPIPKAADVSDKEMLGCLAGHHEVGSASKGMGAVSVGAGSSPIPYSIILAMLAKAGLPVAREGLIALRANIAARGWVDFIKRPVLAALDAVINNLPEMAALKEHATAVGQE